MSLGLNQISLALRNHRMGAGGIAVPDRSILMGSFGDSRASYYIGGAASSPDLNDNAVSRDLLASLTNTVGCSAFSKFGADIESTADGGCSGEQSSQWNAADRVPGTKEYVNFILVASDVIYIQYCTNNIQALVTSAATRDSTASACIGHLQALITQLLADGKVVIWGTTLQRSDTIGGNAYGAANAVNRRECCEYIAYGNGGAIAGMIPWIQAHAQYGVRLIECDLAPLFNLGGASTGAYLDTQWAPDGCHVNYAGSRREAKAVIDRLRLLPGYSYRGVKPMWRSTGSNLIHALNATTVPNAGRAVSNCALPTASFGTTVEGYPYVSWDVVPSGAGAGSFKFEICPDVGTNGGRTPLGGTFAVGDRLKNRIFVNAFKTGSPATAPDVNNLFMYMYCSYIGGVPGLQQRQYGQTGAGVNNHTEIDDMASYSAPPLTMTGDSSLIGAPAAGSGLRLFIQCNFPITATPFTLQVVKPELYKIA